MTPFLRLPLLFGVLCLVVECRPSGTSINPDFEWQDGDLVFHISQSRQSLPIQLATKSPYSHVGIVHLIEGEPYVFEAIQPVRLTPIEDWVDRGQNGHFVVKRLEGGAALNTPQLQTMRDLGQAWLGRDYDELFQWNDDAMYCSELVWKVYARGGGIELCPPSVAADLNLSHPAVEALLLKRYGTWDNVPMNEPIVTPADLFESRQLTTVHEHGQP